MYKQKRVMSGKRSVSAKKQRSDSPKRRKPAATMFYHFFLGLLTLYLLVDFVYYIATGKSIFLQLDTDIQYGLSIGLVTVLVGLVAMTLFAKL